VRIFEDIKSDGIVDISEIKEDDIVATRFWDTMNNPVIEVSVGIDEPYSSASINILEDHTFHQCGFSTSRLPDKECMTTERVLVERDSISVIFRESEEHR
jgi:hypothetical protein